MEAESSAFPQPASRASARWDCAGSTDVPRRLKAALPFSEDRGKCEGPA